MKKYLVMVALFALFAAGDARAATVMADLENALMCKCEDKCGKVLINCNCSTSEKTRADLKKRLDSGLTKEQILQAYVDKDGEAILSAPTKKGFNLTAWFTPFVALIAGGFGVRKLIRDWLKKKDGGSDDAAASAAGPASDKFSKQLQSELDKLDS